MVRPEERTATHARPYAVWAIPLALCLMRCNVVAGVVIGADRLALDR